MFIPSGRTCLINLFFWPAQTRKQHINSHSDQDQRPQIAPGEPSTKPQSDENRRDDQGAAHVPAEIRQQQAGNRFQ